MNRLLNYIKKYFNKLSGFFPSALPVGVTEFGKWADSIIETYDLQGLADKDSIYYVFATAVLHLDPDRAYVAKWLMAKKVRKAAANQISSYTFQEIKTRQDAARKAAQTSAEATALKVVAADGPQK